MACPQREQVTHYEQVVQANNRSAVVQREDGITADAAIGQEGGAEEGEVAQHDGRVHTED